MNLLEVFPILIMSLIVSFTIFLNIFSEKNTSLKKHRLIFVPKRIENDDKKISRN